MILGFSDGLNTIHGLELKTGLLTAFQKILIFEPLCDPNLANQEKMNVKPSNKFVC